MTHRQLVRVLMIGAYLVGVSAALMRLPDWMLFLPPVALAITFAFDAD